MLNKRIWIFSLMSIHNKIKCPSCANTHIKLIHITFLAVIQIVWLPSETKNLKKRFHPEKIFTQKIIFFDIYFNNAKFLNSEKEILIFLVFQIWSSKFVSRCRLLLLNLIRYLNFYLQVSWFCIEEMLTQLSELPWSYLTTVIWQLSANFTQTLEQVRWQMHSWSLEVHNSS